MVGPRAFSTGPGVFADTNFQSLEEAESVVARYKKYFRTNTLKSYMIGNRRQRQWMIAACRKNALPFEVVPGVSAALAVPAYAGVPLTPAGVSSVHLVYPHGEDDLQLRHYLATPVTIFLGGDDTGDENLNESAEAKALFAFTTPPLSVTMKWLRFIR